MSIDRNDAPIPSGDHDEFAHGCLYPQIRAHRWITINGWKIEEFESDSRLVTMIDGVHCIVPYEQAIKAAAKDFSRVKR